MLAVNAILMTFIASINMRVGMAYYLHEFGEFQECNEINLGLQLSDTCHLL